MIKSSAPAAAPFVAARPAAAPEPEARGTEGETRAGGFSDVLDAQSARSEGDRVEADRIDDRRGTGEKDREERDDRCDATPVKDGESKPAPQAVGEANSPSTPVADPMIALCVAQGGATSAESGAASAALVRTGAAAAVTAGACAAPVGDAGSPEVRSGLDGGIQKSLALAGLAAQAAAAPAQGAELPGRGDDAAALRAIDQGSTATPLVTDARANARPATIDVPATPARPPELRSPLGTAAWGDELGARVSWMVERGEQVASLRLSPENLGPVEVRIAVREGETSVWFGAANADTRAALEQSLPRLKEMLGASGLALANAGVSSHTPRDPQRGFTAAALARAAQESGAEASGAIVMQVSNRGLVDLYA